jgi:cytochrome c
VPKAPEAALPAEKGLTATATSAEAAMRKSDCFTCHGVDKKMVGPAYAWVAYRYKDDKEAVVRLVTKVRNGGMGQWNADTGGAPMTPHAQLSDDEIKAMVEWVLSQNPVEPPKA